MYRNARDANDQIPSEGEYKKVTGAGNNMERPMCFLNTAPVQSQLTLCNKDHYEKLVVPHRVKNIHVFCETQEFVTVFTAVLQLSPLSAR
jgi:hypothetical protein